MVDLATTEFWTTSVFSFLSGSLGQLVVVLGGVVLVVLAKGVVRPTHKRAFQRDDFAVGIDLSVLAIITLFTGAVAEYATSEPAAASSFTLASVGNDEAETRQLSLLLLAVIFTLVAAALVFYMQRRGWCTEDEIKDWKSRELSKLQLRQPAAMEEDLPEPPRIRLINGIVVPVIVGGLLLVLAVRAVVHG